MRSTARNEVGPTPGGIARTVRGARPAWLSRMREPVPPTLPDGSPWPSVAILLMEDGDGSDVSESLSACAEQDYPALRVVSVPPPSARFPRALAGADCAYVLPLAAGDRLAPGALAALVLAARMHGADAVAGLRVVHHDTVLFLDIAASSRGILDVAEAVSAVKAGAETGWRGGDVIFRREALKRAGGVSPTAPDWIAELWPRLAHSGTRIEPIARPVLLQRRPPGLCMPEPRRLRVAAVNDTGSAGGAGIAHRRMVEALRLAGHDVSEHVLGHESPSVAAEWTRSFPATEAAILAGSPDVVLAGNLHGATRSSTFLDRLAARVPVVATLHDLFLLTGRCAHPAGCDRIVGGGCDALCPTTTFYPQLAPARVAEAWAGKRRLLGSASPPLLLANSAWTTAEARRLGPAGTRVAEIALPFPGQVFRPGDKAALRRRLGLPAHDVLILFAAAIADQADKGARDLATTLAAVAGPGVGFVGIGRIDDSGSFPLPNLFAPGPVGDEETLAAWFSACDIHVTASRLETLGQTPIEAGLCGLPTIAYRATGLEAAVIDGVSGILVDPEPGALAAALARLIADPDLRARLSGAGRIALEGRNSHAAAALDLHAAFAGIGLLPGAAETGRIVLPPAMFGAFAMAAEPIPGATGTAPSPPGRASRIARRLKHRVFGRARPLWMRRALYAAHRLRAGLWKA